MRVLVLSQYFWPENFRVNDLCAELIARGHQITVLTGWPNYPDGQVFPNFRADPAAFSTWHFDPDGELRVDVQCAAARDGVNPHHRMRRIWKLPLQLAQLELMRLRAGEQRPPWLEVVNRFQSMDVLLHPL